MTEPQLAGLAPRAAGGTGPPPQNAARECAKRSPQGPPAF